MPRSTQFATITRTLTTYRLSLKLNLDISQSLYRVGVQVFASLQRGTQSRFSSESPPEIGEPFTDIEADFKRVILPGTSAVFYGKNHILSVARDYALAAPFLLRVLPDNVNI